MNFLGSVKYLNNNEEVTEADDEQWSKEAHCGRVNDESC